MDTLRDAHGNTVAFETLPNGQMHLYYKLARGDEFELVGPLSGLLRRLRSALNELDLQTLQA